MGNRRAERIGVWGCLGTCPKFTIQCTNVSPELSGAELQQSWSEVKHVPRLATPFVGSEQDTVVFGE